MDKPIQMKMADEATHKYINEVVRFIISKGKGPEGFSASIALSISLVVQVFIAGGGNPENTEEIGEAIKQGVITILGAYKQQARATHKPSGRLN